MRITALESLDAGKPIAGVLRQDFPAAIDTLTYYAGWADKISGEVVSTRDDALTYTMREPVGVVAVIVPWNFPLMIGMWKLAPALACGCTIVMKPAELTSLRTCGSANWRSRRACLRACSTSSPVPAAWSATPSSLIRMWTR